MEIKINEKLIKRDAEKIGIKGLCVNQSKKGVGIDLAEANDGSKNEKELMDNIVLQNKKIKTIKKD